MEKILSAEELFEDFVKLTQSMLNKNWTYEEYKNYGIALIEERDKALIEQYIESKKPKKNMWGANIKDSDDFFDRITKDAGPRD